MTFAATAPSVFELRSTSVTVLSLVLRSASLDALKAELQTEYGNAPGMFEDDMLVLDLGHIEAGAATIDYAALVAALRAVRLLPVAVRGGSEAQRAAARAAGLGDVGDAGETHGSSPQTHPPVAAATLPLDHLPSTVRGDAVTSEIEGTAARTTVAAYPAEVEPVLPVAASTPTLVVERPLRSGQQVYARGGDLVVLAAVNYGAEVIADGNVHVYGPLRGKAIAGAKGDTSARIFSTSLQPELLAIAGTYRTSEHPLPADVVGRPAQVRLDGGRLVFEPLGG